MKGKLSSCFSAFIGKFFKAPDNGAHSFKYRTVFGNVSAGVQYEYRNPVAGLLQVFSQFVFLQPVSFTHESFDTIAVYRFFKIPATNANACLQYSLFIFGKPDDFKGEIGKLLSFTEQPVYLFAAFQFVFFPEKISLTVGQF